MYDLVTKCAFIEGSCSIESSHRWFNDSESKITPVDELNSSMIKDYF